MPKVDGEIILFEGYVCKLDPSLGSVVTMDIYFVVCTITICTSSI
jgi:hypothetical protein